MWSGLSAQPCVLTGLYYYPSTLTDARARRRGAERLRVQQDLGLLVRGSPVQTSTSLLDYPANSQWFTDPELDPARASRSRRSGGGALDGNPIVYNLKITQKGLLQPVLRL